MSNALTLHDMSPGLRKGVGRASPRATVAEEPEAGNPLVRIWRGAELGNRSAYSTTAFSTDGARHPVAHPVPPGVTPQSHQRLRGRQAGRAPRRAARAQTAHETKRARLRHPNVSAQRFFQ